MQRGGVVVNGQDWQIPTLHKMDGKNPLDDKKNITGGGKENVGSEKDLDSKKFEQDNKLVAQVIKELDLPARIQKSGMTNQEAGKFFGWEKAHNSKNSSNFTKQILIENGWTKEIIESVAESYAKIAEVAPRNPSAKLRAEQLKSLLQLF